jgi:release factor glutamine methyltransferase
MKFEDKVAILRKEKHSGIETKAFLQDVVAMAQGESLEYLLGKVIFCGTSIDLSFRPMIPRKETEFWVTQVINSLDKRKAYRILDSFAGSGCVGMSVYKALSHATLVSAELDGSSLKQLEKNKQVLEKKDGDIIVVASDVLDAVKGVFDIIFAVPPYVNPKNKEEVMEELSSEQEVFFFDKDDGYFFIKALLEQAKDHLGEGGVLYLETENDQVEKVKEMLPLYGYRCESTLYDPYGNPYVLVCKHI